MADFNKVADEVFEILRSFDYTVRLYDANSMAIVEPTDTRRFVAGRADGPKNVTVALLDDDDNSRITLSIGKSVHLNDVMGLNQQLRILATKYNMIFKMRQYGKVISPKQFLRVAAIAEQKDSNMYVCEEMYGTSRSSYLRMGNARMIVHHKQPIDDRAGARGRHVAAIFVETVTGTRHRLPTVNLLAGRAMTQHVNQGGGLTDPIAQQIASMAAEYRNLALGVRAAVTEAAAPLRAACRSKQIRLLQTFERLASPTSYAAEIAAFTPLSSSAVPIADLRRLLLGRQPAAVYESCGRALTEETPDEPFQTYGRPPIGRGFKNQEPIKPAEPPPEPAAPLEEGRPRNIPMMKVLGQSVSTEAWHAFWDDKQLPLRQDVEFDPRAQNDIDSLSHKLHQIADVVQDESLCTLFDKVAQYLPDERDPKRRQIFRSIAIRALRAVTGRQVAPSFESRLADKNQVVAEHLTWFEQFDPDRLLTEDEFALDLGAPVLDAMPTLAGMSEFDGDAFVASPEMQDIIAGRDPHDPDQNAVSKQEIMQALDVYLGRDVSDSFEDSGDMMYNEAVAALQRRGFVVSESSLVEGSDELTIEDILLPNRNQGADLAGDVTKADIADPDDPDQHGKPDSAYTSRLMTLAGMRMGSPY